MIKTLNAGLIPDEQVLRMASQAYDRGDISTLPIDLLHAVELLHEAGILQLPRNYYFLGVGESQYNEEFDND